jgi:2-polyprenyl-3-methyl-5-hydroxy-6-metoxy-1,4-benzoquinol methylase
MIIHKLLLRYFRHGDDEEFYTCQASDSIRWLQAAGVPLGPSTRALDLGCGHGIFGRELLKMGCQVTFADEINILVPEVQSARFLKINLDGEDMAVLGKYDLVICSNVYEHLARPEKFISEMERLVEPGGKFYLSWTNWLSPFGGHEFSPFHYLGARTGRKLKMALSGKPTKHRVGENLHITYIGTTLRLIRAHSRLRIERTAARYYTEFSSVLKVPVLREFLAWNCALLLGQGAGSR